MRKSLFLTLVLSLCMVDFGAFAAARGGRGSAPAAGGNAAPVAARAGARQKVVATSSAPSTSSAASAPATNGNTAARAGKKQQVASGPKPMAARAGATQKVIQTGSKVATATTNTAVPQECQDSFFGCMDAFCMLDNTSGGRCQCSDRVIELDKVLAEILKLDEKSYAMATEGVERIQMGDAEEQILARAKSAADKVTGKEEERKAEEAKKKSRTLDLSAWNNNIYNEEEDIFGGADAGAVVDPVDTFADKRGDELYKAVAKMCVTKVPKNCKEHGSMVQLIYAQRIKSDCAAYENSLKQQKIASAQKLQAAEKALREAALEEHKNQNKYETAGACAVAFAQCMQTTAECGSDYTGCVTLAAKENVTNNKSGSKAAQTTIKGAVAGANITLAASTMEALLVKKEICAHITKQCVNANKNDAVWNVFLRNAAPALKSAEEIAEQRLRMNCIPSVADCFKEACKSQIDPNNKEGSYDMCLTNPKTYKSLCKVQLEPCLAATGGSYDNPEASTLWNGLLSALAAMKVDACTQQVKECLTADTACGADYSNCIGLDTETIADMCPTDKLTACRDDSKFKNTMGKKDQAVRDYVNNIAQGISLQIDNAQLATCQAALKTAMETYCGAEDDCPNASVDTHMFDGLMDIQICKTGTAQCSPDPHTFDKADVIKAQVFPRLVGRTDLSQLNYSESFEQKKDDKGNVVKNVFYMADGMNVSSDSDKNGYATAGLSQIAKSLNSSFNSKVAAIENDPKVSFCMTGRKVQTTDGDVIGKTKVEKGKNKDTDIIRFPNLTKNVRYVVGQRLVDQLWSAYYEAETKVKEDKWNGVQEKINERVAELIQLAQSEQNEYNSKMCLAQKESPDFHTGCTSRGRRGETTSAEPQYDSATGVCKVTRKRYACTKRVAGCCWHWPSEADGTVISESSTQMKVVNRENVLNHDSL